MKWPSNSNLGGTSFESFASFVVALAERGEVECFGSEDERQVGLLAANIEIAAVPAFFREVGDALHFDSLGVVGVALDFELAALRQVFGAGLEFEIVGAHSQRQRGFAVDVEVAAELGRAGHV